MNAILACVQVYKAILDDVQIVALKVLHIDSAGTQKAQRQFQEEINVMRACRHDNIVRFLGSYLSEETVYMVQEFCENGTHWPYCRALAPLWPFLGVYGCWMGRVCLSCGYPRPQHSAGIHFEALLPADLSPACLPGRHDVRMAGHYPAIRTHGPGSQCRSRLPAHAAAADVTDLHLVAGDLFSALESDEHEGDRRMGWYQRSDSS